MEEVGGELMSGRQGGGREGEREGGRGREKGHVAAMVESG